MRKTSFSVIIPAHNEEAYIGKCLRAVHAAAASVLPLKTEVIVVANRCTDKTAAIAEAMDAKVVHNGERCIAAARGLKYGILRRAYAVTSARKFDRFGDWYLIRGRSLTKQLFTGKNREAADKFYYDVR